MLTEAEDGTGIFTLVAEDELPGHDSSFENLPAFSEGEPSANESYGVLLIKAVLVRKAREQ